MFRNAILYGANNFREITSRNKNNKSRICIPPSKVSVKKLVDCSKKVLFTMPYLTFSNKDIAIAIGVF